MGVIKGQNLRLMIGGKCVGAATNSTLHTTAATEDVSTKDSTGDWAENEVTGLSWDASSEALVVDTEDSGAAGLESIWAAYTSKEPVQVEFIQTNGDKNRQAVASGIHFTGNGVINDLSIQAQNKANVTLSIQIQGHGELALSVN